MILTGRVGDLTPSVGIKGKTIGRGRDADMCIADRYSSNCCYIYYLLFDIKKKNAFGILNKYNILTLLSSLAPPNHTRVGS